jgi:hypothetical protein
VQSFSEDLAELALLDWQAFVEVSEDLLARLSALRNRDALSR